MQRLVVFSILLGVCLSASLLNAQFDSYLASKGLPTRAERQFGGQCVRVTCGAAGTGCLGDATPECAVMCTNAYGACLMNGTSACDCTLDMLACFANNADPLCVASGAFLGALCLQACAATPNVCPAPPAVITTPMCGVGLICSNTSTCAAGVAVGGACDESAQCAPLSLFDSPPECTNGVCAAPLRATGDACTTAANCASGICTSSRCVGKANGATCSTTDECRFGSYCDGTCMANHAVGASCTSGDQCGQFGNCNNGTCGFIYSGAVGSVCDDSSACLFGTHCGTGHTCVANTAAVTCDSDEDCSAVGGDSYCVCNAAGAKTCTQGDGFPTDCTATLTSFMTCVQTNGCQQSAPFAFSSSACVRVHCANEGACATACFLSSAGAAPYANSGCFAGLPSCQTTGGSTGTASDSSAFALSFSASLLLAIAAFFF